MWVWVDRLGGIVLDASLSALLLFSLVGLAMLTSRQPARRLRLARAGLIGSLALMPLIGLRLVPQFNPLTAMRDVGLRSHPLLPPHWSPITPGLDAAIEEVPESPMVSEPPATWPIRAVLCVYGLGVACELCWLALGWAVLAWLTRRATAPSAGSLALYESLPHAPVRRRPRLLVAARIRRPALVGAFRPSILIPADLDHPAASDRLRLSLLHELAHAEAADARFGLLGSLAQALWFFLPPLWWVRAQMRLDQEFLADRRAAGEFGPGRSYASSLVDLASNRAEPPAFGWSGNAGVERTGSALFQRVLMLVHCPFPVEARPPGWWSIGLPCLAVAITLAVASVSLRYSTPPPPSPARANVFRLARLEIDPAPAASHGRAPLFELPIRLPEQFELTVEAWGNPSSLARTRVVGLPLTLPAVLLISPVLPADEWHAVRVRRDRETVSLWIDGHAVPFARPAEPITAWLSVEALPDSSAHFQNLQLTW